MAGRALELGDVIGGRYRVMRFLAKGGMASVYEVEHQLTEKRLALKILHPHVLDNRAARDSFELEAKVAARVDSKHVVQVHDAGVELLDNHEAPYLVMELLSGETLEQRSQREGPLPSQTVLPWLEQIAAGLDAAHQHRNADGEAQPIIHRDLKPENIFLHRASSASETIKILDFGIAKLVTRSAQTSQVIRGTPLYIAFEQLTGRRVSGATDIWSLGLITFTLLGGCSYWLSATRKDARPEALFAEIVTLPLEPPSARLRALGLSASMHPGFDAWFLRCIDRDPGRRFASAGHAVGELGRVLTQQPLVVRRGDAEALLATAPDSTERALPEHTLPSSVPTPNTNSAPSAALGTTRAGDEALTANDVAADEAITLRKVTGAAQDTPAGTLGESHPAVSSGRAASHERTSPRVRWFIGAAIVAGTLGWLGLSLYQHRPPAKTARESPTLASPEVMSKPTTTTVAAGTASDAQSRQDEPPTAPASARERGPMVVPSVASAQGVGEIAPAPTAAPSSSTPGVRVAGPQPKVDVAKVPSVRAAPAPRTTAPVKKRHKPIDAYSTY